MTHPMDWPEEEVEDLRLVQLPVSTEAVTGRSGSSASSIALHEASHAVTGFSLGSRFISVTVIPQWIERKTDDGVVLQTAYGHVQYDQAERIQLLDDYPENIVFETLAPHVAHAAIGFSAIGLAPDQRQLMALAPVFNIPSSDDELTPEMLAWITDMHQRTVKIVTPLLKDIVRVAEQLDKRLTLSYEEVREILNQPLVGSEKNRTVTGP